LGIVIYFRNTFCIFVEKYTVYSSTHLEATSSGDGAEKRVRWELPDPGLLVLVADLRIPLFGLVKGSFTSLDIIWLQTTQLLIIALNSEIFQYFRK